MVTFDGLQHASLTRGNLYPQGLVLPTNASPSVSQISVHSQCTVGVVVVVVVEIITLYQVQPGRIYVMARLAG